MEAIAVTAVHEAAHAVVGYIFGEKLIAVTILGDSRGEVVPECSWCDTCWEYYHGRNPQRHAHSRQIQDIYRRDAAVAIAGELAECRFMGQSELANPEEIEADREKVRSRASAIHLFVDADCFTQGKWARNEPCGLCEAFVAALRQVVSTILEEQRIWESIMVLAQELRLKQRMEAHEVSEVLAARNVLFGSRSVNQLPPAP
jgi:hypothetical protein